MVLIMRIALTLGFLVATSLAAVQVGTTHSSASAALAADGAVRTFRVPVTSSRGYRFTLTITLRQPPRLTMRPGYNVGKTNVIVDPSWISLSVQNRTPGRWLEVLRSPHIIAVRVAWRIPGGQSLEQGSLREDYFRAMTQFHPDYRSTDRLRIPPNGRIELQRSSVFSGGGITNIPDRAASRFRRIVQTRPLYIYVLADSVRGDVLSGYWDACGAFQRLALIAALDGSGRRLPLNKTTCDNIGKAGHYG